MPESKTLIIENNSHLKAKNLDESLKELLKSICIDTEIGELNVDIRLITELKSLIEKKKLIGAVGEEINYSYTTEIVLRNLLEDIRYYNSSQKFYKIYTALNKILPKPIYIEE